MFGNQGAATSGMRPVIPIDFSTEGNLETGYVASWLARIVPPEDARHARLEDLVRRFGTL